MTGVLSLMRSQGYFWRENKYFMSLMLLFVSKLNDFIHICIVNNSGRQDRCHSQVTILENNFYFVSISKGS